MKKIYPYRIKTHTGARPTWTMMRLNLEYICTERSKAHRKIVSANFTRNLMEEKKREKEKENKCLEELRIEVIDLETSIRDSNDVLLDGAFKRFIDEVGNDKIPDDFEGKVKRYEKTIKELKKLLRVHGNMSMRERTIKTKWRETE